MTTSITDYARHLAEQRPPLTAEQVEAAARILATVQPDEAAA